MQTEETMQQCSRVSNPSEESSSRYVNTIVSVGMCFRDGEEEEWGGEGNEKRQLVSADGGRVQMSVRSCLLAQSHPCSVNGEAAALLFVAPPKLP